jgi:alpha-galactosidase
MPPGPDAPPKPINFGGDFVERLEAYTRGDEVELDLPREREVPATWLDALAGDTSEGRFSINMTNLGAVPNLPDHAILEIEGVTDSAGVRGIYVGEAPVSLVGLLQKRIAWQELVADAGVKGDRGLALQAVLLDELTVRPELAEAMLEELLSAR